jgi:hypothetical protein
MGQAKKRGTLDQRIQQAQDVKDQQQDLILQHFRAMAPGFPQLVMDRDTGRDLDAKMAKHMPLFKRYPDAENTYWFARSTPEWGKDHTTGHYFVHVTHRDHHTGSKFTQLQQQTPDIQDINIMIEMLWMPVYTTRHALQRWRQRTHLDTQLGIPGSSEMLTAKHFVDEFRLRGAPRQRAWGCPVNDGIFLGEWITRQEMHTLGIGWDKQIGTHSIAAWKHDTPSYIMTPDGARVNPQSQRVVTATQHKESDEWFFLAKTFISYRDASFGQASLAMSYDKDPETAAQQFRRAGAEEWLDHTRESVLTKKAREMNVLQ